MDSGGFHIASLHFGDAGRPLARERGEADAVHAFTAGLEHLQHHQNPRPAQYAHGAVAHGQQQKSGQGGVVRKAHAALAAESRLFDPCPFSSSRDMPKASK